MVEEGVERRLAEILSADVEGYSRLMDADEVGTVRTLGEHRSAATGLSEPTTAEWCRRRAIPCWPSSGALWRRCSAPSRPSERPARATKRSPETEGMIDCAKVRAMKPGAYIVNFGRGALIDGLDILYEALEDGHLAGVGLDVFPDEPPANTDHPLFRHPNFVGDPHVLASTAGAEARCSRSVVRDVSAVLRGQRPEWCINPEVFEAANLRPLALAPDA